MNTLRRVAVYCGSSPGRDPAWLESARQLGGQLAARSIGLVYGGGNMGIMGELARAVMAGGGQAFGVIPERLNGLVDHTELTELVVTPGMHERKAKMIDLADGFIILPGGIGTMEEFFEVLTWQQLGYHSKPEGLLESGGQGSGFFAPVLALLDHLVASGFLKPDHRRNILVAASPEGLLEQMASQTLHISAKLPERR